eukprot:CAMPEP_0172860558 /NCGR_PEP_ID=MMETSP1075-20121228/72158_1 /TAXON_ID=2916 /ORGANISM="Ceratium fusus, Strain PA161109" /LENGTH=59 /DNA_ID=CAMNT_0013708603 /DNA_START=304 /DNA_END=480 /DNA_ORIENTATION=+
MRTHSHSQPQNEWCLLGPSQAASQMPSAEAAQRPGSEHSGAQTAQELTFCCGLTRRLFY